MEIGKIIREVRKNKSLSQTQLADKIGVQTSAVSKYEKGIVSPTLLQLNKIASALNVETSVFLGNDNTAALEQISIIKRELVERQSQINEIKYKSDITNEELKLCNELIIEKRAIQSVFDKLISKYPLGEDFFSAKEN